MDLLVTQLRTQDATPEKVVAPEAFSFFNFVVESAATTFSLFRLGDDYYMIVPMNLGVGWLIMRIDSFCNAVLVI